MLFALMWRCLVFTEKLATGAAAGKTRSFPNPSKSSEVLHANIELCVCIYIHINICNMHVYMYLIDNVEIKAFQVGSV